MALDIRTSDNRAPAYLLSSYYPDGVTLVSKAWGTNAKILGVYRHVESVRTGKFEPTSPPTFRANPCVIEHSIATCRTWENTVHAPTGSAKETVEGCPAIFKHDATGGRNLELYEGPSWLRDRAVQKSYAKLNSNDLDLGVEIGELKETISMLRSPFASLRKLLQEPKLLRLLRGDVPGGAKRVAASFADTWMEYRYGVRPLIKSINEIIDFVHAKEDYAANKMRRSRGKVLYEASTSSQKLTTGTYLHVFTRTVQHTYKLKAVSGVYYVWAGIPTMMQRLGLTAEDLPLVVWNLTTLSFVVDWFLSVGQWLGSLKPSDLKTVLGQTTSLRVTEETVASVYSAKDYWQRKIDVGGIPEYRRVTERLIRTVGDPKPITPCFGREWVNLLKTIDLVILTWQRVPQVGGRAQIKR